jgi:hypothetical protein
MAFVERSTIPGLTAEQYDKLREMVLRDGPLDGELFHVAGPTSDGFCAIDGWETQEHCDRAMEKWMRAFQEAEISLEGMTPPERFDIHALYTPAATAAG